MCFIFPHFDGLAQEYGNATTNALDLQQSCAKPLIDCL